MTQLPQPKKRRSETAQPLFNKSIASVNKVAFAETFADESEWNEFRQCLERDADLSLLIDRCEKPLTSLQYAKLLYDFGNSCHADDWEYISNCFMSSLKQNDEYKGFNTKFKEMYGEICDCD